MTKYRYVLFLLPLALAQGLGAAEDRSAQLEHLLLQDCGSCHGMTLKGGIGPSLLPANIGNKPDDYLIATILDGHPGTPMPPWRDILSKEDVVWLVRNLRGRSNP